MSLLSDLVKTYDSYFGHESSSMEKMAPIGHLYGSKKQVIDVTIDQSGKFLQASLNGKNEGKTLLAVTEESASRTSAAAVTPHALNDSLMFMTSKHNCEGGINKSYEAYMRQLDEWCRSVYSCDQVKAVYHYLSGHDLVDDLISAGVFPKEKSGLTDPSKFMKYLVRWSVSMDDPQEVKQTWINEKVLSSWTEYYSQYHKAHSEQVLDGMTGEICDVEKLHPKAISAYGNSKLISVAVKENSTLHYQGERFTEDNQIIQIGYQNSQKAHNALGWLIDTQSLAISKNSLPFETSDEKPKYLVCWTPERKKTYKNELSQLLGVKVAGEQNQYESYEKKLKRILYGLGENADVHERTVLLMTDRSGDGRFSPVLYRSFRVESFLKKIQNWYKSCIWYFYDPNAKKFCENSPSLFDIAQCAFGIERISESGIPYLDVNDSVFKDTINTLLDIVLENKKVPDSLIRKLTIQASAPERFAGNEGHKWSNWNKILRTACAMIHYRNLMTDPKKGEKDLSLDKENNNRSYLFGRLLAVVDKIENTALNKKTSDGSKSSHRDTNAMRLWSAYVTHPFTCYANLRNCVAPYLSSLPYGSRKYYEDETQEIMDKLAGQENLNRPLEPDYLIGFYMERETLNQYRAANADDKQEKNDLQGGENGTE